MEETEIIDTKCREGLKMIHGQVKEVQDKLEVVSLSVLDSNSNKNTPPLNELAAALAKAQGEMEMAPKDSSAFGNRKYADLATCIKTASKVLSKNGLSVVQRVMLINNKRVLSTMLLHASGQYIESLMDIEVESGGQAKNNLQSLGSSLSYLRRYMYCAIVGLAQEDTDAEPSSPGSSRIYDAPLGYDAPRDIAPKQTGFMQPKTNPFK